MATPKLALIPTGYKAGKLYSVLPQSGVGDFTFARASEATRVDEDGLIETMGNNVPRLDYTDGGCPNFLLEPQRTNLITYSESFDDAYWVKDGSSVVGGFTSLDGTNNAYKLVEGTSNSVHVAWSQASTTSATHCFSLFAKVGERKRIALRDNQAGNSAVFDLESGSVVSGSGGSIVYFGNGFYRITLKGNYASAGTRHEIYILPDNATTATTSYQGDGTSGIYIWGAQVEQGSYPTSYIPTNGSTVTRVAETCTGSGDASTFNDSEGVFMVECSTIADSDIVNETYCISINDGTTSNRIEFLWFSDGKFYTQVGNSGQEFISGDAFNNKILIKYGSGTYNLYVNGFLLITDTYTSLSSLNSLDFKRQGNFPFYGNTKQIQYFNSALTDAELETLTSWQSFLEMANGQNYTII